MLQKRKTAQVLWLELLSPKVMWKFKSPTPQNASSFGNRVIMQKKKRGHNGPLIQNGWLPDKREIWTQTDIEGKLQGQDASGRCHAGATQGTTTRARKGHGKILPGI